MTEWKDEIGASERIWIRANVSNKRIFYDYESAPFLKDDSRLRSFPFPTRRPTQAELLRCLNELVYAKVSHFTEEEMQKQDEDFLASLPRPKPIPVPSTSKPKEAALPPKLTKEQEELRENWRRLLEMTKKGRVDILSVFWERIHGNIKADAGVDTIVPDLDGLDNGGDTLLQVASASGQDSVVRWLLEEKGANPTIQTAVPKKGSAETSSEVGRTPYELASTKSVRDVFRRLAGAHPGWWDWLNEGRIPSVLSKEMEEEQENKKKVRRKGLKEKMKEREERQGSGADSAEEKIERSAEVKPTVGPQKLGGTSDIGGVIGLTPEMRARIERERRARAIEARMQAAKP
jgi:Bacteroidetes VLRF1 release factor